MGDLDLHWMALCLCDDYRALVQKKLIVFWTVFSANLRAKGNCVTILVVVAVCNAWYEKGTLWPS